VAAEENIRSALVGLAGGRVHFAELPQGVPLPCIFCQRESSDRRSSLNQVKSVTRISLRVTCYDATLTGARTLADQVITAMKTAASVNRLNADSFGRDPETEVHSVTLLYDVWETV
jgi:hypothetical protein